MAGLCDTRLGNVGVRNCAIWKYCVIYHESHIVDGANGKATYRIIHTYRAVPLPCPDHVVLLVFRLCCSHLNGKVRSFFILFIPCVILTISHIFQQMYIVGLQTVYISFEDSYMFRRQGAIPRESLFESHTQGRAPAVLRLYRSESYSQGHSTAGSQRCMFEFKHDRLSKACGRPARVTEVWLLLAATRTSSNVHRYTSPYTQ
jgi:hypothetical protein